MVFIHIILLQVAIYNLEFNVSLGFHYFISSDIVLENFLT